MQGRYVNIMIVLVCLVAPGAIRTAIYTKP